MINSVVQQELYQSASSLATLIDKVKSSSSSTVSYLTKSYILEHVKKWSEESEPEMNDTRYIYCLACELVFVIYATHLLFGLVRENSKTRKLNVA